MFRRRAEVSRHKPAIYEKSGGRWQATTWGEFYRKASAAARGLTAIGIGRGDRVAILGPTQAPWAIYDMAAQLVGAVSFGIYPKQSVEQIRYLLEHSEARAVFVDEAGELDNVIAAAAGLDALSAIVPWRVELFDSFAQRDVRLKSPAAFAGEPLDEADVARAQDAIDPDDTAILVYTSGTTGPPKGAMISHTNILSLLSAQSGVFDLFEDDLSLSFLPMAHAAERVLGFFARIASGLTCAYATSVGTVLEELREVQPTLFGSVPRIFEKAHARIHAELDKKPPAAKKIFAAARAVGKRAMPYFQAGEPLPLPLRVAYAAVDALVYRKVRAAFGGRVRWFVTGAAPIALDILSLFWEAGLPIFEAYGMTESTVITHANQPGHVKLGSVGKVISRMECRIAEDGEILLRGPFVFKGYFKNPEATRETIVDGWLHTGDIGAIDADGYLRITDRKKHLIITSGGKNLAPANIERAIKNQSPLVSQVHAHGDRRAYVSALIAPSPIETLELGADLGVIGKDELAARTRELMNNPSARTPALDSAMAKVVGHSELRDRIRAAVRAGNRELAHVEQVRRFVILDRDFSQERGELTPTMKLKRKTIEESFAGVLDRIYDEHGFAIEP
jgi:long-chain acyl-CoA synthetase